MNRLQRINSQVTPQNKIDIKQFSIQEEIPQEAKIYEKKLSGLLDYTVKLQDIQNRDNNWKFYDQKNDITSHYLYDNHKNVVYRGESIFNHSIESIEKLLVDLSEKKNYIEKIAEYEELEKINPSMYIHYLKMKSPVKGFSDRDVVSLGGVFRSDGNQIIAIQTSIDYKKKRPQKKVVRAHLTFQTWVLIKLGDKKTKIIMVGQLIPNGNVPKLIINNQLKSQGMSISYLRDYLDQKL